MCNLLLPSAKLVIRDRRCSTDYCTGPQAISFWINGLNPGLFDGGAWDTNRLANTQEISRTAAYDSQNVYRSAWLSWFLSGRAKEEAETSVRISYDMTFRQRCEYRELSSGGPIGAENQHRSHPPLHPPTRTTHVHIHTLPKQRMRCPPLVEGHHKPGRRTRNILFEGCLYLIKHS